MGKKSDTDSKSVLVLHREDQFYLWDGVDNTDVMNCYRAFNKFYSLLRRNSIFVYFTLKKEFINNFREYDVLIFPDTMVTNGMLKWTKKNKRKKQRVIILCRNKLASIRNFSYKMAQNLGFEVWSYVKQDCEKYCFHYYKQFFNWKNLALTNDEIKYDAVFVGLIKDRRDEIKEIKGFLESYGLKTWFFVPLMKELSGNKAVGKNFILYNDYLDMISKAKSIVDIVSESNYGLTLRPIEALLYEKKLITNYRQIKEEEFYSPDNVFIYGEDTDIQGFFNKPFKKINKNIVEKYDVNFFIKTLLRDS